MDDDHANDIITGAIGQYYTFDRLAKTEEDDGQKTAEFREKFQTFIDDYE